MILLSESGLEAPTHFAAGSLWSAVTVVFRQVDFFFATAAGIFLINVSFRSPLSSNTFCNTLCWTGTRPKPLLTTYPVSHVEFNSEVQWNPHTVNMWNISVVQRVKKDLAFTEAWPADFHISVVHMNAATTCKALIYACRGSYSQTPACIYLHPWQHWSNSDIIVVSIKTCIEFPIEKPFLIVKWLLQFCRWLEILKDRKWGKTIWGIREQTFCYRIKIHHVQLVTGIL